MGGVKVLVADDDLERAREVLREWDQGAFVLEGETMDAPPVFKVLERPVFSPDAAMLWSLLLTPAFTFAIEIANHNIMRKKEGIIQSCLMFVITLAMSLWMTMLALEARIDFFAPTAASLALSFITVSYYFMFGRQQSAELIQEYGAHYARRPMFQWALAVGVVMALTAWVLTSFPDL